MSSVIVNEDTLDYLERVDKYGRPIWTTEFKKAYRYTSKRRMEQDLILCQKNDARVHSERVSR